MKKMLVMPLLIFSLIVLGCPGENPQDDVTTVEYQDGLYKVTYDHFDSHGWKPFLEIQVRGGRIVSAVYDYENPEGQLKSQDLDYAEAMEGRTGGMNPSKASNMLIESLVEKNSAPVDTVTGATHSSDIFNIMAAVGLEKALGGDQAIQVLSMNDTYSASDEADSRGYTADIEITFEDGEITVINYTEGKDGLTKWDDAAYNSRMKEASGISWAEAATLLQNVLIETQDLSQVDAITGATGLSERFVKLAGQALENR